MENIENLKLFVIENEIDDIGNTRYRYVSLFNGARGTWLYTEDGAIRQGEKHSDIIKMLLN